MTSPRVTATLFLLGSGFLAYGSTGAAPASAIVPAPAEATGILTGHLAEGSACDQIWSVPTLYKNAANPILQELAIQGQLQTQYGYGSSNSGNYGSGNLAESSTWDDVEVRRFRLGLRARLFQSLKFHSLLDLNPNLEPGVYQRTAEAYLTYALCDAFNLAAGKAELKFTHEQEPSSSEYLTFERSQLVNMFYGGELTGAWVYGKGIAGGWLYQLGVYSNERVDEWPRFDGGTMVLAKIGYDYARVSGFDAALAQLHYLHNSRPGYTASPTDFTSPRFSNCLALSNDITKGRGGLATELFWGQGTLGQANVAGISIMPTYFLAEKLQLVTTLQFAASNGDNGICLPTRYEGQVDLPKSEKSGDTYFAGYAGLNYYLYGHKLKFMSGVKYSTLSGGEKSFSGWTWLAGCRMSF